MDSKKSDPHDLAMRGPDMGKVPHKPEYILVYGSEVNLPCLVADKIRDGYSPVGGLVWTGERNRYAQAMVK